MKTTILTLILLQIAGVAFCQPNDFPAQELWSVDIDSATCLGSVWGAAGEVCCQVGSSHYMRLYRGNQLQWECDTLDGGVTQAVAIDFGTGRGPELFGVYWKAFRPTGSGSQASEYLSRFSGEHFSSRSDSEVGYILIDQPDPPPDIYSETRDYISFIGHFPDEYPDSSNHIITAQSYSSSSSGPDGFFSSEYRYFQGAFTESTNEDASIFVRSSASFRQSGRMNEIRGETALRLDFVNHQGVLIDSVNIADLEWNGDGYMLQIQKILPVRMADSSYVLVFYSSFFQLTGESRFFTLIDPVNMRIVSDTPFDPRGYFVTYRRPGEDQNDDYLILLTGSALYVYDLPNLRQIYYVSNFGEPPIGVALGDFVGDGNTEMVVLTETYLKCYSIGTLGVERGGNPSLPSLLSLTPFPNPFNSSTAVSYSLPANSNVRMAVYDLLGQEVALLYQGAQAAGVHRVIWNGESAAPGLYFCRLQAGSFQATRKLILLK